MVGYVVKYNEYNNTQKFYTYNKAFAVKMAKKKNGTIYKADEKIIKKAIDISI